MTDEDTLKALTTKRGHIKARLTRFSTYMESIRQTADTSQLKIRFENINTALSDFEDIQSQIDILSTKPSEQETEQETFENQYFELVSRAVSLLNANIPNSNVTSPTTEITNSNSSAHIPSVKLPAINLPKFSGQYDDWLPFHDLFNSLVHNNTSLSDVEKFHYLQTSLDENVKPILSSLQASSQNYVTAWELLKERYDNKRIIVNKHISALVNIEPATRENASFLRSILDSINKHIRCLTSLEQPVDKWDAILIFILTKKLDSFSLRHWENQNTSKEVPSMDRFIQFLQNRCQVLEALDDHKPDRKQTFPSHQNIPSKDSSSIHHANMHDEHGQRPSFSQRPTNNQCKLCNNSHHELFKCPRFLIQSPDGRLTTVRHLNLCTNCLSPGHLKVNCISGSCKLCSKKHNTLLHQDLNQTPQMQQFSPNPQSNIPLPLKSPENILPASQPPNTPQQVFLTTAVRVRHNHGRKSSTEDSLHHVPIMKPQASRGYYQSFSLRCNKAKLRDSYSQAAPRLDSRKAYNLPTWKQSRKKFNNYNLFQLNQNHQSDNSVYNTMYS